MPEQKALIFDKKPTVESIPSAVDNTEQAPTGPAVADWAAGRVRGVAEVESARDAANPGPEKPSVDPGSKPSLRLCTDDEKMHFTLLATHREQGVSASQRTRCWRQ